eukprot:1769577-Prymnesium_polylepis.1
MSGERTRIAPGHPPGSRVGALGSSGRRVAGRPPRSAPGVSPPCRGRARRGRVCVRKCAWITSVRATS